MPIPELNKKAENDGKKRKLKMNISTKSKKIFIGQH